MSSAIEIVIDLRDFMGELKRTLRGEIAYNVEYLAELVSFKTAEGKDIPVTSFRLECEICDTELRISPCPECQVAASDDCSLCDGMGGFLICPICDEEFL